MILAAFALISATPATLPAALASAKPGDTIALQGAFGRIVVKSKQGLAIDARGATLTALEVQGSTGVSVRGGTVDSADLSAWRAVFVRDSAGVTIEGMTVTGAMTGIAVMTSRDVRLRGNLVHDVRVDCMQLAGTPGAIVEGNTCRDSRPIASVYDAKGALVKDGDHADCVQLWPLAGFPAADIRITGNICFGDMQGLWGNGRDGDGSGFSRLTIERNWLRVGFWHGIALDNISSSIVRGNRVEGNGTVHVRGARRRP